MYLFICTVDFKECSLFKKVYNIAGSPRKYCAVADHDDLVVFSTFLPRVHKLITFRPECFLKYVDIFYRLQYRLAGI